MMQIVILREGKNKNAANEFWMKIKTEIYYLTIFNINKLYAKNLNLCPESYFWVIIGKIVLAHFINFRHRNMNNKIENIESKLLIISFAFKWNV